METLPGRRTADGAWVAWYDADVIHACVESGTPVRVIGPDRRPYVVTLIRAGRPFTWAGERVAYGYPDRPVCPVAPRPTRPTRRTR